jgi:shikimate dehydrogenase
VGLHLSEPVGAVRRAAVLGRPIAHSLSPALHRAAYAELGLDAWRYDAIECGADELAGLVADAGPEWVGFSVTMPGKRAALAAASDVSDRARLVGAANTLVRDDRGGWLADNTDVEGIGQALIESGVTDVAGRRALLLGAGGTAQAVVVALANLGVNVVDVVVRDRTRTAELADAARRANIDLIVGELADGNLDERLGRAELVISTLPAGAADVLAGRAWSDATVLLDAIYDPWPTAIARAVERGGGSVVGGLEILLHQAAAQVSLMTGQPAPVPAMRAALTAAAASRS